MLLKNVFEKIRKKNYDLCIFFYNIKIIIILVRFDTKIILKMLAVKDKNSLFEKQGYLFSLK